MPQQAGRPQLIQNSSSDEPIAVLGITAAGQEEVNFDTRLSLKRWAEQVLARRLEQADGIAQAVLVGAVQPEVQIRYRPEAVNRYGLSLSGIGNLVEQANLFTTSGELRDGWYRYSLKIQSRIQSIEDIRQVPLTRLGTGKVLMLSDVAEIEMAEADPSSFALADGQRVLSMLVKKEYGANTVEAYDTMLPLLQELERQNEDVNIEVLNENASYIHRYSAQYRFAQRTYPGHRFAG
jgi:HAE1 family hydrophobic/amphiphilic exporter-1